MNCPQLTRLMLVVATLILLTVACGPDGDPGTGNELAAELTITIGTADRPAEFEATLRCGTGADGTGYLADTAPAVCDFLRTSDDARLLLSVGPAPDRVCTEIYGGGEIADISGTLDGHTIDVAIDRANGCGIADWDLLQPVLVQPYDLARQTATADCSGATAPTDHPADQGDLPPAVAGLRTTLLNGAASCDLEGLAAIAVADGTNVSFGGDDEPAALWRDLESGGATPMADLVAVLQLTPGTMDLGQGTVFYVWPAVAALDDWNEATEEQRSELADLFGADALAGWDLFGGYIGYRVGITESGDWAFFVAGD